MQLSRYFFLEWQAVRVINSYSYYSRSTSEIIRINLLDTPGHIDFTMEVEQSLHAVDGVIVILDGTAGVEAQTVTVWTQADKHKLPRVIFVNKMDRPDANFDMCVEQLKEKLDVKPICTQYPVKNANGQLSKYICMHKIRLANK